MTRIAEAISFPHVSIEGLRLSGFSRKQVRARDEYPRVIFNFIFRLLSDWYSDIRGTFDTECVLVTEIQYFCSGLAEGCNRRSSLLSIFSSPEMINWLPRALSENTQLRGLAAF